MQKPRSLASLGMTRIFFWCGMTSVSVCSGANAFPGNVLVFQNDLRYGLLGGVGERECGVLHAQAGGYLTGSPVKSNGRAAAGHADYFAIAPAYAVAPAGAQGFHRGFFGGEACGITLDAVGLGVAVADFARRVDAE